MGIIKYAIVASLLNERPSVPKESVIHHSTIWERDPVWFVLFMIGISILFCLVPFVTKPPKDP